MKGNMSKFVMKGLNLVKENGPTILTVTAVVGVLSLVPLATRAGIKAKKIFEEEGIDKGNIKETLKETPMKVVGAVAKAYAPVAITGVATIGCIVGANVVHLKKTAALASLYALAGDKIKEYEKTMPTMLSDQKVNEFKGKTAQDSVDESFANGKTPIIIETGHGMTLCKDEMSGRLFYHDIQMVKEAVTKFNTFVLSDFSGSLNDFYDYLDLDPIGFGDYIGWNCADPLKLTYDAALAPDGRPCLVLQYVTLPGWNYRAV